jgi:hypothetical protein
MKLPEKEKGALVRELFLLVKSNLFVKLSYLTCLIDFVEPCGVHEFHLIN